MPDFIPELDFDFNLSLDTVLNFSLRILVSLLILLIGLKIVQKLVSLIGKKLEKSSVDKSLLYFILSFSKISLQIMLLITVASMLGVEMTAFIALLASASFAVGLALQGSLSNFAGGILILFLKPFKIGDYIEVSDQSGTVHEIQIFYTILNTPDNKKVTIPNANVSSSSVVNYTANSTRRIDFKLGVSYEAPAQMVREILEKIAQEHPLLLKEPQHQIFLAEHDDSAIIFYFRVWCETANYWPIYFEIMEKVKSEFDKNNISIPYPQMDVHLIEAKKDVV